MQPGFAIPCGSAQSKWRPLRPTGERIRRRRRRPPIELRPLHARVGDQHDHARAQSCPALLIHQNDEELLEIALALRRRHPKRVNRYLRKQLMHGARAARSFQHDRRRRREPMRRSGRRPGLSLADGRSSFSLVQLYVADKDTLLARWAKALMSRVPSQCRGRRLRQQAGDRLGGAAAQGAVRRCGVSMAA